MAKNIEEFLRMAAARRQQQGANAPQRPIQEQPEQRGVTPQSRTQSREIIEIVDDVEVIDPLRDQSVGTHVRSHIDTSDIAEHTRHLGEQVSQSGAAVEQRLQAKFDHDVGHLGADHIADANEYSAEFIHAEHDDVAPKAKELTELLKSPKSFRQAIILSEILNRPNFD